MSEAASSVEINAAGGTTPGVQCEQMLRKFIGVMLRRDSFALFHFPVL
jgi:hypothetical protein